MQLTEIHGRIEASEYKPWQVYFLAVAISSCVGLYLDITLVTSTLQLFETIFSTWDWVVILAIQGVLIGFVAEYLYEQGSGYAKSGSYRFGSKDRILLFRIGVMTIISGLITMVIPPIMEHLTNFLVIQTSGAVIALGILLVHASSRDWNKATEWPAILAGIILAIVPSVL